MKHSLEAIDKRSDTVGEAAKPEIPRPSWGEGVRRTICQELQVAAARVICQVANGRHGEHGDSAEGAQRRGRVERR